MKLFRVVSWFNTETTIDIVDTLIIRINMSIMNPFLGTYNAVY